VTETERAAHLSPEQLAEREGVPLDTVYGWNRKGAGPRYMKIGRHVRYRVADVIAWEQSRLVASRRTA
jgi:excisionase family DNA binding protein